MPSYQCFGRSVKFDLGRREMGQKVVGLPCRWCVCCLFSFECFQHDDRWGMSSVDLRCLDCKFNCHLLRQTEHPPRLAGISFRRCACLDCSRCSCLKALCHSARCLQLWESFSFPGMCSSFDKVNSSHSGKESPSSENKICMLNSSMMTWSMILDARFMRSLPRTSRMNLQKLEGYSLELETASIKQLLSLENCFGDVCTS